MSGKFVSLVASAKDCASCIMYQESQFFRSFWRTVTVSISIHVAMALD